MRVLVLSDLWPPFPGGAERLAFNLARSLMQRGLDVRVLTGYENAQRFDGPLVARAAIGVFDTQPAGAELVRAYIEYVHPDVILTHHLYAHQFSDVLDASGIPYVQVVLNGQRLPGAAFAVYISQWVRERARPHLASVLGAHDDGDLVMIPPAFDDIVAETHGDGIGFIKPIEHKGVELFYEIAAAMPERRFVVLRGEWQTLEDIRPMPNVEFVEPVDDMRDFYARVRLLLVPSRSEDAGTVAQEATANGLPCISSNVDGLVETNEGGVLLDRDDLAAWVHMIRLLDNETLRAAVVARQRARHDPVVRDRQLDQFAARISALG